MATTNFIREAIDYDILKKGSDEDYFVGRPFQLDYSKVQLLINDYWKNRVNGIPQGCFLIAFYDNPRVEHATEAILLRALSPVRLPTDLDNMTSMIEYYKDNLDTSGVRNQLDEFTRYEFSFSGLECRVLGSFYYTGKVKNQNVEFGADIANFYSPNNYKIFKPTPKALSKIVNLRDADLLAGGGNEFKIGSVRYSSSRFNTSESDDVKVYISPKDFLGQRTALFGMTRTGKSNTAKKIIEATHEISKKADYKLNDYLREEIDGNFNKEGSPTFNVGQIIFDINGEYANPNLQDEGTAIFELYNEVVTRYSVIKKEGFKVLKVNFYNELQAGFELISNAVQDNSDYMKSFKAVDLSEPDPDAGYSDKIRWQRKKYAYFCCLYKAGFKPPKNFEIKFQGKKELNERVAAGKTIDPSSGISFEDAITWFTRIWELHRDGDEFFTDYKRKKGHDWVDEDLKAILTVLTQRKEQGGGRISGFIKLRPIKDQHTPTAGTPYEKEIIDSLRKGEIIIIDLSQGNPEIQNLFSEDICRKIFNDSMGKFIKNEPNNFIQFYFEEAHNLFPKKDDKDLSQIYNRLAKEGAKLNIGLIYATQEVSSISSNILKNTQNWFISHLNNEDELKELKKYYDFEDFTASLTKFSASNDKGFARMKTHSNPYVVPVQVDRFTAKKDS